METSEMELERGPVEEAPSEVVVENKESEITTGEGTTVTVERSEEAVAPMEVSPGESSTPTTDETKITSATVTSATPTTVTPTDNASTTPALLKTQSVLEAEDKLIKSFATTKAPIEVVFSFDVTGSMFGVLQDLRKNLSTTARKLLTDIPAIRIGMMAMGDYCDSQPLRSLDFSRDASRICNWVETVTATSGGDWEECYELVLREAKKLSWSPGSNRALVVIGDAVPHPPSYTDQLIYWRDELQALVDMGIKVYGIFAAGSDGRAVESILFYQELAAKSGGVFLPLKHFSLITDMFLAVCYREFGEEQLESFRLQVEERGSLDDHRKEMFGELQAPKRTNSIVNHVYPWWVKENEVKPISHSFYYDDKKDKWTRKRNSRASSPRKPRAAAADSPKPKSPKSAKVARTKRTRTTASETNGVEDDEKEKAKESPKKRSPRRRSPAKRNASTDSDPSPSISTRRRKREIEVELEEEPKPKMNVAVRGEKSQTWLGQVVSINGEDIEVMWFEELRKLPNYFVLLNWKDSIPLGSVIKSPVKFEYEEERGIYELIDDDIFV